MASFKTIKKHHKHLNHPFPSKPKTLPFIQGNLVFNSQTLNSEQIFDIGHHFQFNWSSNIGGSVSIFHKSNLSRSIWSTVAGRAFISASTADTEVEESRGSFVFKDKEIHLVCSHQTIESIEVIEESDDLMLHVNDQDFPSFRYAKEKERDPKRARSPVVLITGRIFNVKERKRKIQSSKFQETGELMEKLTSTHAKYWMLFDQKNSNQVGFQVRLAKPNWGHPTKLSPRTYSYKGITRRIGRIRKLRVGWCGYFTRKRVAITFSPAQEENVAMKNEYLTEFNRICITYSSEKSERFYGFGEQLSHMDFKGKRVPIFVQEQGIGRGDQPITFAANLVSYRAGGDESTTYAPSPIYITSKMRSLYLEGYNYSVFDLTKHDSVQIQMDEKSNVRRNLYEEAMKLDILVKDKNGGPYMVPNTAFDVGMLDLTHPKTASWFKQILQEMVDDGVRGWMADFGEGLPVDACVYSGEDPITAHNRYPELWAQINREYVEEWRSTHAGNRNEVHEEDLVFFMRAGFRDSPKWANLFWEGDQMVSWQANDGIKSAVVGLLSSGLSGYAFNHSDIGGYCAVNLPFIKYQRSEELLLRWMELNAFTTVFRTHEGNKPSCNSQFYSNQRTQSHFSRFAKMYKAWKFYRIQLVKHVWTGKIYSKQGSEVFVEAPTGYPAILSRMDQKLEKPF